MARLQQFERVRQELWKRSALEYDNLAFEALYCASQVIDVLEYLAQMLTEHDRLLERKFKAATRAANQSPAAAPLSAIATRVLRGEATDADELLHRALTAAPDGALPFWFGTEAVVFGAYRQAIAQLMRLLQHGILQPGIDLHVWSELEHDAEALSQAATAAAVLAREARGHAMEERFGRDLCSSLEGISAVAAPLSLLLNEWKPRERDVEQRENLYWRLDRIFERAPAWLDEAVRMVSLRVGYRPPPELTKGLAHA